MLQTHLPAQPGTPAAPALRWKQTTIELPADAGAKASPLEARFAFLNSGDAPVRIESLQSDCGCTTAELARRDYAPGEGGQIVARFDVGERVGWQEKHVTVAVAGQEAPTTLTLVVLIPELLKLRPALLFWNQGEGKAPKKLLVEAGEGVTIKMLAVHSSQALFAPELRTVEEGRRYELTVTPARTDLPLMAPLSLSGEFALDGGGPTVPKVFTAYAAVKAPPTAAGGGR